MIRPHAGSSIFLACLLAACGSSTDPAAERAAVAAVDAMMVEAANANDMDAWLGHFADDAVMMPPNANILSGKAAIRALMQGMPERPGSSVVHKPGATVVVAQSGDVAYMAYEFEISYRNERGETIRESGKDVSIFEKQSDGAWRIVVDVWNSNAAD